MSIKALIIDDEPQARILLKHLIIENCTQVEVIGECQDLPNAVKAIRKLKPDLVFLDIEMPGHSGLELLDFFDEDEMNFGVIFTTAYNQYAIKAFKLSAIDYLLKPLDADELMEAVKRFEKRSTSKEELVELKKQFTLGANAPKRIAVPVGQTVKFIDTDSIVYLKAESSYTEIMYNETEKLLVSRTLKNFEEALKNDPNFFRCHKSYIVNTLFLVDYVKSDGGFLILKNNIEIPISSDKSEEFLEKVTFVKR